MMDGDGDGGWYFSGGLRGRVVIMISVGDCGG